MKLKRGNLLTVILALLCAVAAAIGVSFALPKAENISAQASGSPSDIKIVSYIAYYYSDPSVNAPSTVAGLSTTSTFGDSVISSPTSLNFSMTTSTQTKKVVYVEFKVGVNVPAWEEWEISYQVKFNLTVVTTSSGINQSSGLYYFYPNPAAGTYDATTYTYNSAYDNSTCVELSEMMISKDTNPTVSNNQYYCDGKKGAGSYSHTATIDSGYEVNNKTITLTNNSGSSKQFTFSYAAGYTCGGSASNRISAFAISVESTGFKSKELYVTAPKDVEINYTGNDLKTDAEALIEETDWYKREPTSNDSYIHSAGEWASYTLPSTAVINVIKTSSGLGGYDVTYSLTDPTNHPFKDANDKFTTDDQTFKIKVKPIDPPDLTDYLSVNAAGNTLLEGQQLNTVTIDWDTAATIPPDIASGAVAWYSPSNTLQSGTNNYRYKFTSNSDNYNSVDNRNYSLTAGALVFADIDVTYVQGSSKIFPSTSTKLTDGASLPGTLTVTKLNNAGNSMGTVPLNECTVSVKSGTTLTGGSTGTITVEYGGFSKDITVNVSAPKLVSITASQKPGTAITESTKMQQLAQMLEVKATFEDGQTKTLAFTDYTVSTASGTLTVSSSCPVDVEVDDAGDTAKANWQNANSGKCSTTISVDAANLLSISANWTNGQPSPVYDRTPLNDLKPYLTVTAQYDDQGSKDLADDDYILKGNLTNVANGGSAVLNVEYGGQKAQVQLSNIIKAQLTSVAVTYFDNTQKVYDTDEPDIISENGMVIVTATYAQFTNGIIVTSDCTFTGDLVASDIDKSILHVYFDGNEVDYGTYLDNGGLGVWVDAGNVTLLNKPTAANTTFTYNGNDQTLTIANLDNAYMAVVGSLQQTAVGTYTVTISLKDPANYRWDDRSKADVVINWDIKQLVLNPQVEDQTYSGNEIALKDILNLTSSDWNFITASGVVKKTDVGSYSATLTIKPEHLGNVVWAAQSITPVKKPVKFALTAVSASADCTVNWNITPAVIAATWDDSRTIPVLNLTSASVANVPADLIVYTFTDVETGKTLSSNKLEKGHDYIVTASININDPRANNYAFTAPQPYELSIAAAQPNFAQKLASFMTQTAAGLPIWAWFLIALAALILLIIIIVVAVKRRKTKEEREEIKARKEEEKARKEEERLRRDEERRLQQERLEEERRLQREKLEAERELARAKQEAELEKIRAQAQAGMAGAGMATMAMAQQPTQQAMPPIQQVQTVDNDFVKEMREQMAELRADNKATQEKLAAMQNNQQPAMPAPMMPMQQPMYQQYPSYQQMPMMPQYGGDPTLARLEAQLNAMQAEQRARYDAEQRIELAAMRAEQHVDRDSRHSVDLAAMREHINGHNYNRIPDYSNASANNQPNSIEALGAIVAAALKNMANGETAATQVPELPQKAEQEPVAKYSSDAVITTTTTVDTTKNGAIRRSRDEEATFDVDGFYDTFE